MARRKKGGLLDEVVGGVAMLPWWVGVVVAAASFAVLHWYAGKPVDAQLRPGQATAMVASTFLNTLASVGQYLIPLFCLGGAGVSAWRQKQRRALASDVAAGNPADSINALTWQQFEQLVGEGFRLQGYRVTEAGGGGPDGGIDLVLHRDGEKHLVQCKQWRAVMVSVTVVRELFGVMAAQGAAGGFVVTSGRFTDEAQRFADGRNITLLDGAALLRLIRAAQRAPGRSPPLAAGPAVTAAPAGAMPPSADPACPSCGSAMVRRTAKRGATAGAAFWGCSSYPACKGTRPIP